MYIFYKCVLKKLIIYYIFYLHTIYYIYFITFTIINMPIKLGTLYNYFSFTETCWRPVTKLVSSSEKHEKIGKQDEGSQDQF